VKNGSLIFERFLFLLLLLLGFQPPLNAEPVSCAGLTLERQAFYFTQALANYEHNWQKLERLHGELWPNFGVRRPADYLFAQTAVEVFLNENPQFRTDYAKNQVFPMSRLGEIVAMIRNMQELSPASPDCGNFYWYWFQRTVEDRNAVEFVVQRLLYCWAHRDVLPEEIHPKILEILRDAAPAVLRRRFEPTYTNIAILNLSNLILLGEALEDAALTAEGLRRLNRFVFWTWENGIHEFGSPTYFTTDLEGLEELRLLTRNAVVREKAEALIRYWSLVIRLHLREKGRLAGAYSRTYNFLYGDEYLAFHVGTWGWCDLPADRSNITILAALALYNGPTFGGAGERSETEGGDETTNRLHLTTPALRATSPEMGCVREKWGTHWKTTFQTTDFSVGTTDAPSGSHQDQLWTVDWSPSSPTDRNARCFFVADGRGDPWGVNREETRGGHQKAFHLDPQWDAVQRNDQTRCRAFYPPEMIQNLRRENPEAVLHSTFVLKRPDEFCFLAPSRLAARYGKNWLVLMVESASNAQSADGFADSPDGNAVAWCVTHDLESGAKTGAELVFTSRIVTDLETFQPVGELARPQNSDGILTVNGQEIGRPFFESVLPSLGEYVKAEAIPVDVNPENPCVIPAQRAWFWRDFAEGDAVLVQAPTEFHLRVAQPGKYRLAARLLAVDPKHDSLKVAYGPKTEVGPQKETRIPCWALGSSDDWRTVELHETLDLPAGDVRLVLEPREFDVRVKELILKKQ